MAERRDIHAEITETILGQLRQGIRPWMKPWGDGQTGDHEGAGLPLRVTGAPYGGINVLVLWSAAAAKGYKSPTWMTFKQAADLGGGVRKREKGEKVVYASRFTKKTVDRDTGLEVERDMAFHRTYTVFNVEQIDGLDERWYRTSVEVRPINPDQRVEKVDRYFRALDIDIRHGGDDAYYVLREDYIQMPPFGLFHDAEGYYSTLAHESVHWTRHTTRLDRKFRSKSPQDSYAKEELVAEIGSAFLAAELGFTPCVREDHANYIGAWLRVLGSDSRAIFTAASHASKAANWLHKHAQAQGMVLDAAIGEGAAIAPVSAVAGAGAENRPTVEPKPRTVPGIAPGAVQGELFRAVPAADANLIAARDARAFATAACAFRGRGSDGEDEAGWRQEASRLLAAAGRIDLDTPGVRAAIQATLAVSGGGRGAVVGAEAFLSGFRAELQRRLDPRFGAQDLRSPHRADVRRGGVSM